jgi:hypothetical protein
MLSLFLTHPIVAEMINLRGRGLQLRKAFIRLRGCQQRSEADVRSSVGLKIGIEGTTLGEKSCWRSEK